jgi:hypothetical protein
MHDCNCTACLEAEEIEREGNDLCYRETPEAIANRARRDEMARIVSRCVWIRPIDRLPDKSRRETRLVDVLKDAYGPSYEPYERDCLFRERSHYETRRERVKGIPARARHEIAEAYGYRRKRDRLNELLYQENPFFSLIPKTKTFAAERPDA